MKAILDMPIEKAAQEINSRLVDGGESPFADPSEAVGWFAAHTGWTPLDEAVKVAESAQKNGHSWNDEFFGLSV